MAGMIWDVFIEDDRARVKKMIGFKAADTITPPRRWIAHKKAFHRFHSKFCLKLCGDVSKAAHAPDPQVSNRRFAAMKNLKGGDMNGQGGRDSEIVEKSGGECRLAPVVQRQLCSCDHCKHTSLDGAENA